MPLVCCFSSSAFMWTPSTRSEGWEMLSITWFMLRVLPPSWLSSVRSGQQTRTENWASSSLGQRTYVANFLTAK